MSEFIMLLIIDVLPLLGPLLILIGGFVLWRTRRRERRWPLVGSLVVVVGISFMALALWLLPDMYAPVLGPVNLLVERVIGETPQAKVSSYLALVARGEQDKALALWPASERLGPEYEARRHSVTTELERLGPELSHQVLKIEWWGTCCEPHITTDSRGAGFARLWVEVSGGDEPSQYIFDVFTRFGYWGKMEGYPVRHWQIVDAYPVGEEPLYWLWPGR